MAKQRGWSWMYGWRGPQILIQIHFARLVFGYGYGGGFCSLALGPISFAVHMHPCVLESGGGKFDYRPESYVRNDEKILRVYGEGLL